MNHQLLHIKDPSTRPPRKIKCPRQTHYSLRYESKSVMGGFTPHIAPPHNKNSPLPVPAIHGVTRSNIIASLFKYRRRPQKLCNICVLSRRCRDARSTRIAFSEIRHFFAERALAGRKTWRCSVGETMTNRPRPAVAQNGGAFLTDYESRKINF